MERITKISHKGKEIVVTDYSNLKTEVEMIELLTKAKEIILKDNKKCLIYADYTGAYAPPRYMSEAHKFVKETRHLVDKGAFMGITGAKTVLLAGIVKLFGLNFKSFVDGKAAFDFLVL
jgi:predicted ribosome-associated RNA-binding protein Tma20